MRDENYIVIQGWMRNVLKLSGNELVAYALIYGFCQDRETRFSGSLSYISDALGLTKVNARNVLLRLVEKGLLTKIDEVINGVRFCRYGISETDTGVYLKQIRGISETDTPLLIDIYNEKNIGDRDSTAPTQTSLFETSENPNKKTLFKNCTIGTREKFMQKFSGPEYAPFDLDDYFNGINNWSNQQNVKRTLAGWVSTLDAWIRRDLKKGTAVYKPEYDPNKQTQAAQTDYLNDFRG